ncbi:hypothetical protein Q75_08445 [Bacillus coahuilensis p1.1.43]|uniref:YpoC-like domain-containing protein n=1 Tax=Bacillus coahuilensis p1.1.43 TaxID=1150625 RepID=A0A147K8L4_9BACI|nr:hypothetical protein [Bacillus coahuilensis]KUP06542.1 hypothetical protein Q75_08445 [Bacillus coahuilensis p1.1.43]
MKVDFSKGKKLILETQNNSVGEHTKFNYPFYTSEIKGLQGSYYSNIQRNYSVWNELKDEISQTIQDKSHSKGMIIGMTLFIEMMYWTNNQLVHADWAERLQTLIFVPLNVSERLSFIQERPYSYQSFKQLHELIQEQMKKAAKQHINN